MIFKGFSVVKNYLRPNVIYFLVVIASRNQFSPVKYFKDHQQITFHT